MRDGLLASDYSRELRSLWRIYVNGAPPAKASHLEGNGFQKLSTHGIMATDQSPVRANTAEKNKCLV